MNVPQESQTVLDQAVNHYVAEQIQSDHVSAGQLSFDGYLKQPLLLSESVKKGIPFTLFNSIRQTLPYTNSDWTLFLQLTAKDLKYYELEGRRFDAVRSEKILQLAEVAQKGKEVFGDGQKFYLWLQTTIPALGNKKPRDLLHNSFGKEMLITELIRIEHGILA